MAFFFLICLLILICRISDDTLRITTLSFFYSQLTDETAAHRVICCLLYHFFSNAIIARAVHCFHNSIPVTAALEEYASSHQGPSSSVAQAHWGGPQNGLEGQWRRKISVQVKLLFFHACWLLILFIASFRPPTPQSPLHINNFYLSILNFDVLHGE